MRPVRYVYLFCIGVVLASCSDSDPSKFVGTWRVNTRSGTETLEFFKEGTVLIHSSSGEKITCKYDVIENNILKIDFPSFMGTVTAICKYRYQRNKVQFLAGGDCPYEGESMTRVD